jgi:hypothetical protein
MHVETFSLAVSIQIFVGKQIPLATKNYLVKFIIVLTPQILNK